MIVLTILKVILKIILILLLTVLLLLVALLLLRLKYSISASYEDTFDARAKLSILFGALEAAYRTDGDDPGLEFKIFGHTLKKKDQEKPPKDGDYDFYDEDDPDIPDTDESETQDKPEPTPEPGNTSASEDKPRPKKQKAKKPPKKESFWEKAKNAYNSFDNFRERYDIPLLLRNIKIYLFQQIRSLGIKGGSLNGILGLSDPSQTGMAIGGLSVVRAFAPLEIDIAGEFEKKYIALNANIYGKTYPLKLILPILKLIFKKPVRTIIYDILTKKGTKK